MNIFTFSGNLGDDARLEFTAEGKPVLNFNVACRSGWGDREQTNWIECALWGNRGEAMAGKLAKGDRVVVAGELSTRTYQRRSDGATVTRLCVRVTDITPMQGSGSSQDRQDGAARAVPRPGGATHAGTPRVDPGGCEAPTAASIDDDIPF